MKHSSQNSFAMLMLGAAAIVATGAGGRLMQARASISEIAIDQARIEPASGIADAPGFAGDFLASYHAQSLYDWKNANHYLERVLAQDPENPELLRRSMVLAMGAGDLQTASTRARRLMEMQPADASNALGVMILTVDDIAANKLPEALVQVDKMPAGDMTDFIRPIMRSWILAGQGKFDLAGFNPTTVHLYHGALMAIMLDKKQTAREFADKISSTDGISPMETERAADLYAAIGDREKALGFYKQLVAERPNEVLEEKITAANTPGSDMSGLIRPLMVKTAAQGVALAMFDMANILNNDQTDSSTKLFAQMAIALDPNLIDARLLLADSLARNGRLDEAIGYFRDIPKMHKAYIPAQRYAADLLAEAGQIDKAREVLNELFTHYGDVESLVRIGDLYRGQENYKEALVWYDKAARQLGEKVPEDFWHLLYARGMAYERVGAWDKAQVDLQAALAYRPDHPYLLNYLGYGWADKGTHLDQSLKMIQRAVELRPSDGYITDSLGWIYYMMGKDKEAIPHLERAVELLPYDSTINDHLGDAYWFAGRKLEAKFQWERAHDAAEDATIKALIAKKIEQGPPARQLVKEADSGKK